MELYRVDDTTSGYPDSANQLSNLSFKATKAAYQTQDIDHNLDYCYNHSPNDILYLAFARSKSSTVYYISHQNASPEIYNGAWSDVSSMCDQIIGIDFAYNYRGFNSEDTTTGPRRSWVGGN